MFLHRTAPVLGCSSINCNVVLTEARGEIKSPCYPEKYPNTHTCKWTLQAPAGFIIQLSFLDFELEEALNCMYDRVLVNTGNAESKFCGLTANGLTLNSTRNEMELSFISDFSIQKRGFMVRFQHVAVALRNQKVKIPSAEVAEVANSVYIPSLNELTICLEVERLDVTQVLMRFPFEGVPSFKGNIYNLRLWNRTLTQQDLESLTCTTVGNIIDWDNSQWLIASSLPQTDNTLSCICFPHCTHLTAAAPTSGSTPLTGCEAGGPSCSAASSPTTSSTDSTNTSHAINATFHASTPTTSMPLIINTSTFSSSASATISTSAAPPPSTAASASSTTHEKSPSKFSSRTTRPKPAVIHNQSLDDGLAPGRNFGFFQMNRRSRRALHPSHSRRTLPPRSFMSSQFNRTHKEFRLPKSSYQPRNIAPTLNPISSRDPSRPRSAFFRGAASYSRPKHSLGFISTPLRKRPSAGKRPAATRATPSKVEVRVTKPSAPKIGLKSTARPVTKNTTPPLGNPTQATDQINRPVFTAKPLSLTHKITTNKSPTTGRDSETLLGPQASLSSQDSSPRQHKDSLFYRVSFTVNSELNQKVEECEKLLNWSHSAAEVRLQQNGGSNSYTCLVLLMTSKSLGEQELTAQLYNNLAASSLQDQIGDISVKVIENCPKDNHLSYLWPETSPRVTQYLPCFPTKDQSISRTCLINPETFASYWSTANLTNCTVTADNAAGVAEQLADLTKNNLTSEEVSQVVTKVHELVSVAKINTTVAESVVNIISNVMVSSKETPGNTSNIALRAMEELAKKLEFDGPSVNITSKHLALGILALNASLFNETSFSTVFLPNSNDPKVEFDRTTNPLAQVTLPSSLLTGVSSGDFDRSSLSRINFMFFSNPNLFMTEQNGWSLNSYVVASSVGNLSIQGLKDPVRIEITHLFDQVPSNRECVFWDFSMRKGDGGWNKQGCVVSEESNTSRTVCYCNHLTHFGILMDISQSSIRMDPENKRVLTFLSYIGCGISAICSAATLLTYIAFEKLRRDYPSKILMNLSTSLLFLNIVFLLDGWLATMVKNEGLCTSAAVLLHYFLLTSFSWMGLESVHMYIALVKVFNTYIRRYILKFCIVGWGLPAVLVGIVVTVNKNHYGILMDREDETAIICWIKNKSVFYTTCVGYFCLMFLLNVAMFIVVMMQICGRNGKRSNRTLREEVLRNLRSVVSLTFLLGMTWGFALFAWGPVYLTFTYLFTIFNSLQGSVSSLSVLSYAENPAD
ncbi:PREDICTED: G-protein coupled receptor 126-like [Cyprinodon variegatus]|uniref:G-protein coupled receptor 126-like n=1 Tax=Cyprinodon variegatus TaxID=28743 RepID=UPI00074273E2|nr:PREDICTED: G-protein coupled receptor 126-like [Cyprinodon variegatus]